MKTKFLLLSTAFGFVAFMAVYFIVNPSYQKSVEAKYYYEMGDYNEAYALANEAFSLDVYNRMASTIMAQSKISMQYTDYIEEAQKYMQIIDEIAKGTTITSGQRARIKLMSEIMLDMYVKLAPSVITDTELVNEAKIHHDNFEQLLEKVNK